MKQSLATLIEMKKNQLARTKPRSRRRLVLYVQIQNLMTQRLRKEIRDGRL